MPRPSHIRNAVQTLLLTGERHDWSIDDLLTALYEQGFACDFSSVFRVLVQLEAAGIARRVELGDGKARFESGGDHHEHVRCTRCGHVAAVPGCSVDDARMVAESSTGYRITGHQVLYSGLCPPCSRKHD